MGIFKINIRQLSRNWWTFRFFCRITHTGWGAFIVPVLLSLSASLFESVSVGLLAPFIRGILKSDFSFLNRWVIVRMAIERVGTMIGDPYTAAYALILVVILGAAVLKNILVYGSNLCVIWNMTRFSHELKCRILERYFHFGRSYFDRTNTGHLANVLGGYPQHVAISLHVLGPMIVSFFMSIAYVTLMMCISWKLTLVALATLPFFYHAVAWILKEIARSSDRWAEASNALADKANNLLTCMTLVKSYNKEAAEEKEFREVSARQMQASFAVERKVNLLNPFQEILGLIILFAVLACITFFVRGNQSEAIAGLTVYFFVFRRMLIAFSSMGRARGTVSSLNGSLNEIKKVFEDEGKGFVSSGQETFPGLKRAIEFRGMYFSYGKNAATLKDLWLVIPRGKMTAIVGATGSGKSTLAHLLMRFYDCPPRSLYVDGKDVRDFTPSSLRARIAFVGQEPLIFNGTLRENLVFGLDRQVSDAELEQALKRSQLWDVVHRLPEKLETRVGERGAHFSGGEKQRIAIARAMLKDAEVVIFDEATSSLDTETERQIQDIVRETILNKTALVITHRLSAIKDADLVALVANGSLKRQGTLEELMTCREFLDLFKEQLPDFDYGTDRAVDVDRIR